MGPLGVIRSVTHQPYTGGGGASVPRCRLTFPPGGDPHCVPWVYRLGWILFRLSFRWYFGWRAAGWENVPPTGPLILASNHASYMDPGLIGGSCSRPITYLGRESLFRNPAVRWLFQAVRARPIDRDGTSGKGMRMILDRLATGDGLVLFPEGTRTLDGAMIPARAGIGMMVLKSEATVLPVRLFGTFEAFGKHRRFPRPSPVGIRFGTPLDLSAERREVATADRARVKELYQEVADRIMRSIADLQPP